MLQVNFSVLIILVSRIGAIFALPNNSVLESINSWRSQPSHPREDILGDCEHCIDNVHLF